jgi:hypothetical protein
LSADRGIGHADAVTTLLVVRRVVPASPWCGYRGSSTVRSGSTSEQGPTVLGQRSGSSVIGAPGSAGGAPGCLDHHVGILEQVLCGDRPEEALAGPEHHGRDVHGDLVDEPGGQHLAADVAGGDLDRAVARELLCLAMAASTPSTKWNGASGRQPSGAGRCDTTTRGRSRWVACRPSRPSGRRRGRPKTVTPTSSQYARVCS